MQVGDREQALLGPKQSAIGVGDERDAGDANAVFFFTSPCKGEVGQRSCPGGGRYQDDPTPDCLRQSDPPLSGEG